MSWFETFLREHRRLIFIIAFVLFSARILQLVLVEPFIGIANNGDFERISRSCGVDYGYNAWSKENYWRSFWEYVPTDFKRLEQRLDTGWWQIFSFVPMMAVAVSNVPPGGHFDIRYVGLVNAAIYLLVLGFMLWVLYSLDGVFSYCGMILLFFIAGDAYIIQYFNSFYTEIGSIDGLFLLVACWISFHVGKTSRFSRRYVLFPVLLIGCVLAVNSKQQDVLLVFPLLFGLYWLMHQIMVRGKVLSIIMCFFVGFTILLTKPTNDQFPGITAFNVIMRDFLKDSSQATEHISRMTKDPLEQCELQQAIGKNAFACGFDWVKYKNVVTRKQELLILLREPSLIFKMTFRRAGNLFSREDSLGNYTRDSGAKPRAKTTSNCLWSRIVKSCYARNLIFWLGWLCFASVYAVFRMMSGRCDWRRSAWSGILFLVTFNVLRFLTVIVGDSSHDDVKHFFALNVEFDIIVAVIMTDVIVRLLTFAKFLAYENGSKKEVS